MDLTQRIESVEKLGEFLRNFKLGDLSNEQSVELNGIVKNDNKNQWCTTTSLPIGLD